MKRTTIRLTMILSVGLLACGGGEAPVANPTSASAAGPSGMAQADQGGALYGEHCASCHGNAGQGTARAPAVVGEGVLPLSALAGAKRNVPFGTAGDVYRWVRLAMPGDDPGSLSDAEYAAILAFALKANGVDLTSVSVTEDWADTIRLH